MAYCSGNESSSGNSGQRAGEHVLLLPDTSNHQPLVITTCLALDPPGQVLAIARSICALDIRQIPLIPMSPHDSSHQQMVLGPSTCHSRLEQLGLMHVFVQAVMQLKQQRIFHVAAELLLDDRFQVAGVLLLVLVGNGADLVVVAQAEDAAHADLVGAELALGCGVQSVHVAVNIGLDDRGGVLGACGLQDNFKVALRLQAQVALDSGNQVLAEGVPVCGLDGVDVGVGAAEEHVVEDTLLGAWASHAVEEGVYVVQERPACDGHKALLEPAAGLVFEIGDEVAAVGACVRFIDGMYLVGVLVGEMGNQGALVCAEAFHRLAEGVGGGPGVPGDDLGRAVAR